MKILKRIGIAIVAIIALLLIVALFVPKEYNITRSVVINKPKAEVFDFVKHIKNQDKYSVWNQADPHMHQESEGTDGTVGFVNRWHGNKEVGTGEQKITGITEGERVDTELAFKEPMEDKFNGYFTTTDEPDNATKVTWGMYGKSPYPFNLMNLCMDGMIGNDLQQNLENMKEYLEKQ
jgi:hypothetical protein